MTYPWKGAGSLFAVFGLAFALACGGGGGDTSNAGGGEEAAPEPAAVVSPAEAATIAGRVSFEGEAPAPVAIDMSEEPVCADKHPDGAFRRAASVTDGGLGDVYVYVKEGLGDMTFPTPSAGVELDQNGCEYVPHIVAIQTGQSLVIKNSDGVLHNINTQPTENRGFNISQPVVMETTRDFSRPEVMIPVKCDVHGWMEAFIGVQDHPYAVVTAPDGSYTIENLPPGDYVIEAWHETYGVQTQSVTIAAQETGEANFAYSADMAGAPVPLGEPIVLHADHGSH